MGLVRLVGIEPTSPTALRHPIFTPRPAREPLRGLSELELAS